MAIRSDLHEHMCECGERLSAVRKFERIPMIYGGEFSGERGVAVIASCHCGTTTAVPWSVELRTVA